VFEISKYQELINLDIKTNDRVVYIYKDNSLEQSQIDELSEIANVNYLLADTKEIRREVINICPISIAKGLEFDIVIAEINLMDENEKYVAMTRALRELWVVNKTNKKLLY